MRVAGVDGTRKGWVAIVLADGRFESDHVLSADTDFSELPRLDVIGIDIPIGFGPRIADELARKFLTGAARTVFKTPPRHILEQAFGPGRGVSAQAHALGRRIIHITELARSDSRIREVHPEVSFRVMNDGRALQYRKKSAGGALERLALLRHNGIEVNGLEEAARVPLDDVLDAAAAAWTAHRIATGTARSLPDPPELIEGYSVAIWY